MSVAPIEVQSANVQAPELTDDDLIRSYVRERSSEAFQEIVRRYNGLVYGVCRQLSGNSQSAEDAFQETFFELSKSAKKIREPNNLASWLFVVAQRTARRFGAKNAKGAKTDSDSVEQVLDNRFMLEEENRQLQNELYAAIEEIDESSRSILLLAFIQQKSHAEVANTLGIPLGSVSHRLQQALSRLKKRLLKRGTLLGIGVLLSMLGSGKVFAGAPAAVVKKTVQKSLTAKTIATAKISSAAMGPVIAATIALVASVGLYAAFQWYSFNTPSQSSVSEDHHVSAVSDDTDEFSLEDCEVGAMIE